MLWRQRLHNKQCHAPRIPVLSAATALGVWSWMNRYLRCRGAGQSSILRHRPPRPVVHRLPAAHRRRFLSPNQTRASQSHFRSPSSPRTSWRTWSPLSRVGRISITSSTSCKREECPRVWTCKDMSRRRISCQSITNRRLRFRWSIRSTATTAPRTRPATATHLPAVAVTRLLWPRQAAAGRGAWRRRRSCPR